MISGGGQPPSWGCQPIIWPNVSKKLYENQSTWTQGAARCRPLQCQINLRVYVLLCFHGRGDYEIRCFLFTEQVRNITVLATGSCNKGLERIPVQYSRHTSLLPIYGINKQNKGVLIKINTRNIFTVSGHILMQFSAISLG